MFSINITTNLFNSDMNTKFIRYIKCVGALVSPNDNQIRIQHIHGGECGLRNVFRMDHDLMITRTEIDLEEDFNIGKLIK
jgi:hypothetical protein